MPQSTMQTPEQIYAAAALPLQTERYDQLVNTFQHLFEKSPSCLLSTPGRIEIGGNHTDHNHGRVLAASVDLDAIAAVGEHPDRRVRMYSDGYEQPFTVDLDRLSIQPGETGQTEGLIRGIAAKLVQHGYNVGGCDIYLTSAVKPGSGLSSSATIEVMIGNIFNHLFNQGRIATDEIARAGQYAENNYFGKPCGLMDQVACAVGGMVTIDFENPDSPEIRKVNFDFDQSGYMLLVVDTGSNHEDLTSDYAAIPEEMKQVAHAFGLPTCRDLSMDQLISNLGEIRARVGDRAVLRAIHFIGENERVLHQVDALESGQFDRFLDLLNQSGNSSFKWLQNIYAPGAVFHQNLSLALALTENFIRANGGRGASRVHGGGFAGTILAFIPVEQVTAYIQMIAPVFGENSVLSLRIRNTGSVCIVR